MKVKYIVLKIVPERNQYSHLALEVLPNDSKALLQPYLHATEAPQLYLLLDLSQDTDDSRQVLNLHLPERSTSIIICRYRQ